MRTLEAAGVDVRGLALLVALFSVDGLRDRVEVVADDAGAALFD